ncbi:MAG: FkbM family methyltransferase [Gammaproteobacteria bacterium]
MLYRLSKLPKYLKAFGIVPGLRLWRQVELRCQANAGLGLRRLDVPGYEAPIHLRATTADHATFWQCMVMEQYDFFAFPQAQHLMRAYRKMLDEGEKPLVIDLGGNIGLATVWLAHKLPEAQFVVVEPDADNLELLRRNTAHLRSRVRLLHGGIWHRPAMLRIVNPESGSAALRVEEHPVGEGRGIRAYTVSEACAIAGASSPFIVKIDIEGAQAHLFSENTEWVGGTHLVTLELDDWQFPWGGTSETFFKTVSRFPFDYLMRDESIFCFRNFGYKSTT